MEQLKEIFHEVVDNSKLKYSHIREILKERSFPTELAQRNLIPEFPLILLHGYGNQPSAWKKFIPYFESNGYIQGKNFFLFDGRGENETPSKIDIRINAKELQNLVQQVLTLTGSTKVNLVGHSMGGLISRWYIEQLGGNDKVHKLIMLGTPNHGSKYLPLLTRIVRYIDDRLETREKHRQKLTQLKNKNALHRAIQKLKEKDEDTQDEETKSQRDEEAMPLTESWFDKKTEQAINEHIQQVISENDIDHLGRAATQMDPGSEFLTTLGYAGHANYYLITGTRGFPTGIGGYLPEGDNDGVVHADSVDLKDVPVTHKVTFKVNHAQLLYKVVTFNQIMNFLIL